MVCNPLVTLSLQNEEFFCRSGDLRLHTRIFTHIRCLHLNLSYKLGFFHKCHKHTIDSVIYATKNKTWELGVTQKRLRPVLGSTHVPELIIIIKIN